VITKDFNSDGIADLASVNGNGYSFSILLGSGTGTFEPARTYGIGGASDSIVSEDFNQDVYLILQCRYSLTIVWLFSTGMEMHIPDRANFATGLNPRFVAAGDLDGDGRIDLVVANYSSDNISIHLGNGDGTFQNAVNYGVGSDPYFVTVADLNGDGRLDIISANHSSEDISILFGNVMARSRQPLTILQPSNRVQLRSATSMLTESQILAVANEYSIAVLMGNGGGTYAPAVHYWAGNTPTSVIVGDFDGDGRIDLAITNNSGTMPLS